MNFQKLRLAGFKSFLDSVEILIEPGVTGVVGPNGCGKSNVVEALKWVMGETSAKQMRGGEMDDVIFGGTSDRPARNIAEVTLFLDNADRDAPAQFNDTDELEVMRRIERGSGSNYKINGRDVRARDVQLLFADLATGAHSTAIVNQGRVGALIGAKPIQRRALLEEAAGITGLHSRRHEAELRLRAAETNLERLDDVIIALEGQFQGLKRQARQAGRYRRLGGHIRRHEAMALHLRWEEGQAALAAAREALQKAETEVARHTEGAAEAARMQAEIAASLPELREAEAIAAAKLQRLLVAQRELEAEEGRIVEALAAVDHRLNQIGSDISREAALSEDAAEALRRLQAEVAELEAAREGEAARREAARKALAEITEQVSAREATLGELTQTVAAAEANRDALVNRRDELARRHETLDARLAEIETERSALVVESDDNGALAGAARVVADVEAELESARRTADETEAAKTAAEAGESDQRQKMQEAQSVRDRLLAEESALTDLLKGAESDLFPPLIDALGVTAGYEAALGSALDDDLSAPLDSAAPVHWKTLPPIPSMAPLPEGATPLSALVNGPPVIARRLDAVGVIENSADGDRLQGDLLPGQRLVSRDGGLWRWDGFTVTAGAQTPAAIRLSQRNRWKEVQGQRAGAETAFESASRAHAASREAVAAAVESDRAARAALQAAYDRLAAARKEQGALADQTASARSRLAALSDMAERLGGDLAETREQRVAIESSVARLVDPIETRAEIERVREEIGNLRTEEGERRSAHDRIAAAAEQREARLAAIDREKSSWDERAGGATARIADLESRCETTQEERARLAARPAEIETQRAALLDGLEAAETKRNAAADRLSEAEEKLGEADAALRRAEAVLAAAREDRVRDEGRVEQAAAECNVIAERIAERLESTPETLLADAEIDPETDFPERDAVEIKLERLIRERDNMGPVNLRAEAELEELEAQIDSMRTEREDLLAAIARLRQGISTLNREGRERLLAAFENVNRHFEDLFTRLFGGGRAHLALTEAEDPLEAGLEIMASPPGKKLQVMSLLSGGEQALTALALLFAVFLTNPAPICILDEVDAPLDDANVDRFCRLLQEIAHSGKTRFIIVTHHRLTMAGVDRLFGVTMGERGVSQLVSVDLREAAAMRDTA